jgi:hypothetical protein
MELSQAYVVQGKYEDAAAAFERAGTPEMVMEMWTDLRQFDKASQWAERVGQGSASVDALRAQQALWSEEVKDYKCDLRNTQDLTPSTVFPKLFGTVL